MGSVVNNWCAHTPFKKSFAAPGLQDNLEDCSLLSRAAMKILAPVCLAVTLLTSLPAMAQEAQEVAAAKIAAESWLKRMDAGDETGTWDASAASLRSEMSKSSWKMVITAVHWPLGEFKSRKLKSAALQKATAGKPGPDKVVIDYVSQYENKANVQETITTVLEKGSSWKVSGYNING
ncbi:DUF4019 domain-containing protein [Janthinobacterium lividum]